MGKGTLLFVDEVHRFRSRDSFLPVMEDGARGAGRRHHRKSVVRAERRFGGARCSVLHSLDPAAIEKLFVHAEKIEGRKLARRGGPRGAGAHGRRRRPRRADAGRRGLARRARKRDLQCRPVAGRVQRRAPIYDKSADGHYNLISALHKSVRGSDPDAALYYLARMMDAGEDPLLLARRVVRR